MGIMNIKTRTASGFTIVELLIVIVVIAILAAISIVAYNGIQERARVSSVSSALSQANKKIAVYQVDNPGQYPADLASIGITNSGNVSYQYSVNNSATPATYCITATAGSTSYKSSSTSTAPTSGGCTGHGQGGVAAITNLAINPSAATGANYWSTNTANSSISRDAAETRTGSLTTGSIRTTVNVAGNASTQLWDGSATPLVPVAAGDSVTISAWVKSSIAGRTLQIADRWRNSSLTELSASSSSNFTLGTSWTRINFTATAPASTTYSHISFYFNNGQVGDNWWIDDVMVTKDATLANYADGASSNWIWNGTQHVSTSTGPAL